MNDNNPGRLGNIISITGAKNMSDDDKLNEIYNTVKDLQQTIRGFNGFEGLVSQVARIEEKQNSIEQALRGIDEIKSNTGNINTLIRVINERGCAFGQTSGIHTPLKQDSQPLPPKPAEDDDNVKWREIREKLFWPLVVALIMIGINAIPKLIALLSNH